MNRPKTHQRLGRVMALLFKAVAVCASATSLMLMDNRPLACGATYTTFQVPGATNTYVKAASGDNVVGFAYDSAGVSHGYLYDGSGYTLLDVPGATLTRAYDIDVNKVLGDYFTSDRTTHGFFYDGASYSLIDVPGASSTIPVALSGNYVVGDCLFAGGYDEHGFLYDGATYRIFDFPGASNTHIVGMSGNTIVGNYSISGDYFARAFFVDSRGYTEINYPGAARTMVEGISGKNIVGVYAMTLALSEPLHGFLYDGSTYTTIDPPWWDPKYGGTMIAAIDGNRIGGFANSTGGQRLFLYDDAAFAEIPVHGGTIEDISGDTIVGTQRIGGTRYGFVYVVPEPSTIVLLGIAAIGLLAFAHRRCQPGK